MAASQGTSTVPTTNPMSFSDERNQPPSAIRTGVKDYVTMILKEQNQTYSQQQNDLMKVVEVHKKLTGKDPLDLQTSSSIVSTNFPLNTKAPTPTSANPVSSKASAPVAPKSKNDKFQKRRLKLQKIFNQNTVLSEHEVKTIFSVIEKDNEKETDAIRELVVNGFLNQLNLQSSFVSQLMERDFPQHLAEWLEEVSGKDNYVINMMKLMEKLPIKLALLQSTSIGKIAKKFTKHQNPELQQVAKVLMAKLQQLLESVATKLAVDEETKEKKKAQAATKPTKVQKLASSNSPPSPSVSKKFPLPTEEKKEKADTSKKPKIRLLSGDDDFFAAKIEPVKKTVVPTEKPLSADAIRKAKFKEKVLADLREKDSGSLKRSSDGESSLNSSSENVKSDPELHSSAETPAPSSAVENPTKKPKSSVWEVEEESPMNLNDSSSEPAPPSVSLKTGKPKKKVSWSTNLEKIHVIVKDESEKKYLRILPNFASKENFHLEKMNLLWQEKLASFSETTKWQKPRELDLESTFNNPRGALSKQAKIQQERELGVLSVNHHVEIADSPNEDELIRNIQFKREELNTDEKAIIIPFDDPLKLAQQQLFKAAAPVVVPTATNTFLNPQVPMNAMPSMNSILPAVNAPNLFGMFNMQQTQPQPQNLQNMTNVLSLLNQLVGGGGQLPFVNPSANPLLSGLPVKQMNPSLFHPMPNLNLMNPQSTMSNPTMTINPPSTQVPFRDRGDRDSGRDYGRDRDRDRGDRDYGRDRDRDSRDRDRGSKKGKPPLCKYFNTPKGCHYGDSCSFLHENQPSHRY